MPPGTNMGRLLATTTRVSMVETAPRGARAQLNGYSAKQIGQGSRATRTVNSHVPPPPHRHGDAVRGYRRPNMDDGHLPAPDEPARGLSSMRSGRGRRDYFGVPRPLRAIDQRWRYRTLCVVTEYDARKAQQIHQRDASEALQDSLKQRAEPAAGPLRIEHQGATR